MSSRREIGRPGIFNQRCLVVVVHPDGVVGSPAHGPPLRVGDVATKGAGGAQARTASRRAAEAMAERARAFAAREKRLERSLTAFHLAEERARAVREEAEAKAAKLAAETEAKVAGVREKAAKDAAGFEADAFAAVGEMKASGEALEVIAELTGWPIAKVRQAQRAQAKPHPDTDN